MHTGCHWSCIVWPSASFAILLISGCGCKRCCSSHNIETLFHDCARTAIWQLRRLYTCKLGLQCSHVSRCLFKFESTPNAMRFAALLLFQGSALSAFPLPTGSGNFGKAGPMKRETIENSWPGSRLLKGPWFAVAQVLLDLRPRR